ncbi:MAG: hypothetical protein NVSMB24_40030 [Mucilaginibacter sp.]
MITDKKIHYTLRFASAMCFIGHGAFGIITKKIWLNYFAVFGIGPAMGSHLMPWLGIIDILIGVSLLLYPTRAVLLWLVIWGAVTALLRPLSGEPFAEAFERAGNYGAPLILLILSGISGKKIRGWFSSISPDTPADEKTLAKAVIGLRIIVFLLLAGHGWLNLVGKKGLMDQYASLGFSNPAQIAHIAGIFELIAAAIVLIRPLRPVLIMLLVWKMGTELFYPHWEVFEWVERGGSYGSILALYFILPVSSVRSQKKSLAGGIAMTGLLLVTLTLLYYSPHGRTSATTTPDIILASIDKPSLQQVMALDRESYHATFVFVNQVPGIAGMHNRVIKLPPIGDELRINFDQYLHKGHNGPLYIILPDNYAGPKEKFILKAFPDYRGWYCSMLSDKFVMYAAK